MSLLSKSLSLLISPEINEHISKKEAEKIINYMPKEKLL